MTNIFFNIILSVLKQEDLNSYVFVPFIFFQRFKLFYNLQIGKSLDANLFQIYFNKNSSIRP